MRAIAVHDELHRARAHIAHRARGRHRISPHGGTLRRAQCGRRRFLDDLLAPALRRAVALAQVQGLALAVGKDLDLDVAAAFDQALQHQLTVAKRAQRLAPRARQGGGQVFGPVHRAHAPPAAARQCLDQQGEAQAQALGQQARLVLLLAQIARHAGHARSQHAALGRGLIAHGGNALGAGADEHQTGGHAGRGEIGALRQKAIARVNRLGPAALRGLQDGGTVQIRLGRCRRAYAQGLIGQADMGRIGIRLAVDRHHAKAHGLRRAGDAAGDLAAVGDQNFVKHGASTSLSACAAGRRGRPGGGLRPAHQCAPLGKVPSSLQMMPSITSSAPPPMETRRPSR